MAAQLSFLLILTGLTGIHSITTVNKVSVKAGGSIIIPCLYGSQYKNNVKYLCKGYQWRSCSYAVKTNQRDSSGKFSISDDKNQRIFTVTIKDLTDEDADYWCAVEINGETDAGEYFHLSVTRGTPSLYVDHQEIRGFNGGSINISCYSRNSGETGWCRLGRSCVTGSSGSIDGTSVTISARDPNVFTVTMSGLTTESSGWYLCHKGDLQMPVHVTVTEKPTTTTLVTTRHFTTLSPTSEPVNLTPGFGDEASTTVQREQHNVSADLMSFIISLSLLSLIVIVTFFIWLSLKKHKQTKAASLSMTEGEGGAIYENTRKRSRKSHAEEDVDVVYSSVVALRKQRPQRQVEADDGNVIYSTLA